MLSMTLADDKSHDASCEVVLDATRNLMWIDSATDARRVACEFVEALGGSIVDAEASSDQALPIDLSFGEGRPILAFAPSNSSERSQLELHLPTFVMDARRILEVVSRVDRFAEDASLDSLTGLANRRMVARAIGRVEEGDVVIMLDLDHFKEVNDTLGHAAGDDVLRAFGAAIRDSMRGREFAGRFGGEEFVVILEASTNPDAFLERLRANWERDRTNPITFSAGFAFARKEASLSLRAADNAMYRAKREGRNRWERAIERDYSKVDQRDSRDRGDDLDGSFVAFSRLEVPTGGEDLLEEAFFNRLGAVERAPGFRSLEVWADLSNPTHYVMVSWWESQMSFRAYMRSADHRRSHDRIPKGDLGPRPAEFRKYRVVSR